MAAIGEAAGGSGAGSISYQFAIYFRISLCLEGKGVAITKVDFIIKFYIN